MSVLTSAQRSTLEKAVIQARKLAETGAQNALQALAVTEPEPFPHQEAKQRMLRNRLRNKGRLLGDELLSNGKQKINHLTYELAYEYWHKMLFAAFLEANGLLIHPEGVAVTLEECEELAKEEGYPNKWATAASYASKMLPAIFRIDDPLMHVEFAPNDRIVLESLIETLDHLIFTANDALGWVYQFWQSEAKETINKSGEKIDGAKLPAVTQLFTEPYMVHFLIDNTLGAWWVSRNPGVKPPIKFDYLKLLEDGTPAAGKFEGWPEKTIEVTALDPCMGSGHFVASLFSVFTQLRMFEEDLTKEEATDKVITKNLYGLELDPRCTQLAAFNLALTAWKFCGHFRELPEMNLACSGIAPTGKKEDWVKLVGKIERTDDKARMEKGMEMLYDHFQLAPELGSLLDPTTIKADAFSTSFEDLQPALLKALESEVDKDLLERGVVAAGIAKAGKILSQQYTLQITNVPYLARGKQDKVLLDYCEKNFPEAKGDLATVFLERMLKANISGGTTCSVILQNWLFLTTYKKFREKLLKNESWSLVARLGAKGFQTPMWDFNVMLICIQHQKPPLIRHFSGLDVSEAPNATAKDEALKTAELRIGNQAEQLNNPDARVVIGENAKGELLSKYAKALQGIATGDFSCFGRLYWELEQIDNGNWIFQQTTFYETAEFVGKRNIIFWEKGKGVLCSSPYARVQGLDSKLRMGIAVTQMASMSATLNVKTVFDNNSSVILPNKDEYLVPIWLYCTSDAYNKDIRKIDQKVSVTNATLVKVPFDLDYWQKVAQEKYPNGLPKPYSDDATQWLFHGHPQKAVTPLHVATARLLGYHWPAEIDEKMELAEEARKLISDVKTFDNYTDEDGILCIPSVNGEPAAAEHLRSYLQQIWDSEWNNHTIEQLLQKEGSSKSNLEDWLREEFFIQHCKVFQNRPFIWHIWDGRKDGFSALVNYHKLTKENLQKLIYTYLGDWIRMCEAKRKAGESGADGLLSAALKLKQKLELILEGEAPFDIFVRWKKPEEQPLGWDPDLNDGVRLNIRPFIQADVLRKKPNIKWGIDRGKNPPDSPWGEIRDNDKNLTLAEKRLARTKSDTKS